jgi:predicted TIM-barrel fold metal-dependent hydrolase
LINQSYTGRVSRVFDLHVHVGPQEEWIPEGLDLATELGDENVVALLGQRDGLGVAIADYLRAEGITNAAAIPVGRGAAQEYTIAESAASGGVLLPFVQYDPRSLPTAAQQFESAIDDGARGLKVHPCSHQLPPNDRSLYPLYETARARGIPVMVHVGSSVFPGAKMKFCDPLLVDEVAADFPDLNILCAHSGRGFWTTQVFALTRMRQNVWMELSGLPPKRILEYFPKIDRVAERVVWGSDWPSSPAPSVLIEQVRRLNLKPEAIDAILWGNAARLFGIEP